MKNVFTLLLIFLTVLQISAQTPQKMSYQAVIRDANGQLMKNRNIGMQVSVLQGSENGTAVFAERFFPSTNENGLVTVEIGGGLSVNGSFAAIDWKTGPFFIKTETDINGGANYTLSATSQLLSVPYALLAKNVENVPSLKMDDLTDVDATNIQAGQLLKWDGTNWKPANDATTGGPGTTYTPGSGISIDVNNVISNTGDLSNTNEIQQLELAGNQLKLTGANTVSLPTVTTYTAGPGISLANNTITNTGDNDNDPDNEIQQISLSGSVLTLSQNGGSVTLPSINGGGDNWGTQHVETNPALSGFGTQANPLDIADGGVTPAKLSETGANHNDALIFDANTNNWVLRKPVNIQEGSGIQVVSSSNGPLNYIINAQDASPTNELQTISLNGSTVTLSQNGGSFTLPTPSPQTLSLSGANLSLSGGGGSVVLPDASSMNEIQVLSLSGANQGTLNLSNGGGSVNLPLHWSYLPGGTRLTNNGTQGLEITGDIRPPFGSNFNLGQSSYRWENVWVKFSIDFGPNQWIRNGGTYIDISDDFLPASNGSYYLGTPNRSWLELHTNKIVNAKHEGDWLPTTNGTVDLGSSTFKWDKLYTNSIVGPVNLDGSMLPVNSSQSDLGSSSKKFRDIYVNSVIGGAGDIEFTASLTAFTSSGHLLPDLTNQKDLGTSSQRWKRLYTNNPVDISSDKRLKENIFPITFGLKEVLNMEPVSYNLKDDKTKSVQFGYMAQDLKKLIPTVVHGDENKEMLSVTYTELIPVLTKAIQEQQVMIDHLKAENEALKQMMKEEMAAIRALIGKSDSLVKNE